MKELRHEHRGRSFFVRGETRESFLQEPRLMTDEQVHEFLFEVFRCGSAAESVLSIMVLPLFLLRGSIYK